MGKIMDVDVAIMGSGVAGMGAAYKLVQNGVRNIAVFEKYPAQGGAVSNAPMCFCSTPDTPEAQKAAYEVLARFSNYRANMGVISKVVKYSSEFPKIFLEELGIISPMKVDRPPADYGNKRGYTMGHANGLDVGDIYFLEGRGQGHAMALALLRLRLKLEKEGVKFYFRTPIKKIIRKSDGKVTGAIAYDKAGEEIRINCRALIVASGGISANLEMMKECGVVRTKYEDAYKEGTLVVKTFEDSCQDGDGQKAVWEIGGKKTAIVLSADPEVPNPGIRIGSNCAWTAASALKIVTEQPYLRVDEFGRRFINEEMADNHTAMSAAYDANPNQCGYLIFDQTTADFLAEHVEEDFVYFIFKGAKCGDIKAQIDAAVAQGNKHMCHFDTIHEVCEYMGICEAGLMKTLEKYNKAAQSGVDEEFKTNPRYIKPVKDESGQIYCFRIFPGGYDTMGGLAIDENGNVIDENNYPIEGLYAAGDMVTGSLYGDPPANAGGTVYGSMPTGMLAGDSAAMYVKGEN